MPTLRVKRLTDTAMLPARADAGAIGLDLFADLAGSGRALIMPGARAVVGTGIAVELPAGTYGRIAPRSGMAVKHGADVLAGVVDPSYRGEVRVVLQIHGDAIEIRHGDRIAQMILERAETPEVEEVSSLDETERGAGGFGSSGR